MKEITPLNSIYIATVTNIIDAKSIEVTIPELLSKPIKAIVVRPLLFGDNDIKLKFSIQKDSKVLIKFEHENIYECFVIGEIHEGDAPEDYFSLETPSYTVAATKNDIEIKHGSTEFKISSSGVDITGNVNITGNLVASGDVKAGGISLKTHKHLIIVPYTPFTGNSGPAT